MSSVIFITTLPLWSLGKKMGGPAFSNTVNKYIAEGWDVYVISDENANIGYDGLEQENNVLVTESLFKKYLQVKKIGAIFRFLNHKVQTYKYFRAGKQIITYIKSDCILYAYEVAGVDACRKLSRKYGIPLVTRFQGTVLSQYRENLFNRIARYPAYNALETEADLVIMTDDGTQGDRVLDELNNNSRRLFVKNGLDLLDKIDIDKIDGDEIKLRYNIGKNEMMFLTVSRLTGWKKVERAINGFKSFLELGGNGKLIIVGDGDKKQELELLAETYQIQKKVVFTGAVEHEQVYSYMKACDVFLSLYDLSNVGNPLLEALTLGCAIITLDVGDTNKVINGENGILLEEEELDILGRKMYELCMNRDLKNRYQQGAREYAKKNLYSWTERMNLEFKEVLKLLETKENR